MSLTRRSFIAAAAPTVGLALWTRSLGLGTPLVANAADGFGPLGAPDALGVRLPPGFTAQLLARSGDAVADTGRNWHDFPDGAGVFARPDGGWIYASNSEVGEAAGGVQSLSFGPDGKIGDLYPILSGTLRNCAGGTTPWNTWLSGEEAGLSHVWECDPFTAGQGVVRTALGTFNHEAAVVDPETGFVYLTEDLPDGRLYRFVPDRPQDLSSGSLFAASVDVTPAAMVTGEPAGVTWMPTSPDAPDRAPNTSAFNGGEGEWVDGRRLLFTTKGDIRVWSLDLDQQRLEVLHDGVAQPDTPLDAVDNIVMHPFSGEIFVAEDGGNMQLVTLRETSDGSVELEAFFQIEGQDGSEITGPGFSPDGQRLYVSSQRGVDGRGLLYEITGPFTRDPDGPPNDLLKRATAFWVKESVRHEALMERAVMKGHRCRVVAATG